MKTILSIIIGYLLGSINTSYILGKIKRVNMLEVNSHNPGAANAKLTFGWWAFIVVWVLDTLKSVCAFYLIKYLFPTPFYNRYIGCIFVVVGHCFSIFMKLKGGKGFSSYGGVVLAFNPLAYLLGSLIALLCAFFANSLALLTLISLVIGPILLLILKGNTIAIISLLVAALFTGYRHLHNFQDLFKGKEPKIFTSRPGISDFLQ